MLNFSYSSIRDFNAIPAILLGSIQGDIRHFNQLTACDIRLRDKASAAKATGYPFRNH
jgi:hypothetical protein